MNDLLDDDLRAALHAEVEAVHADNELLDRIKAAPAHSGRAYVRWLLVAAALALTVGLAASFARGGSDEPAEVDAVDGPTTTTTTVPAPAAPPRPSTVAVVRDDGRLVLIDLDSREERELAFHGDPRETGLEGGPYYIDAVEVAPDGQWVYYSTCCEPAVGTTYRVSVDGGEPERVAYGAYPRLSRDGRYLAVSTSVGIDVLDASAAFQPVASIGVDALHELQCCIGRLSWSPDGRQLAYLAGSGAPGEPQQAGVLDFDGTTLSPADIGKPDNPGSFVSWHEDGMFTVTSGGPVEDDRSLSQDATYHWLLWVDEAGVVRQQDGFESGDQPPIEGLPAALTADW